MTWPVEEGFSFDKYKKQYLKSLYLKLGLEHKEQIDIEFNQRLKENKELLSKCIDPNNLTYTNLSTGLVIGMIQSGKTSSMEMICNLARDNGFRLVIVLSGTVGSLTKQTKERLYKSTNGICWKRIFIPGSADEEQLSRGKRMREVSQEISNAFDTWDNDIYENNEKRTVFILSMKGIKRLEKLHHLISTLKEQDNRVSEVPVLIIDDECDHASLNRRRQSVFDTDLVNLRYPPQFASLKEGEDIDDFLHDNLVSIEELIYLNQKKLDNSNDIKVGEVYQVSTNESATHKRIKHLRKFFKNSSYIGYTATPYANLLQDTWNNLSPNFAQVLNPGEEYTGSKFFFANTDNRNKYIRHIPPSDLSNLENHNDYPSSLKEAIRFFILGVADGIKNKVHHNNSSRSMFVHISSETSDDIGGNLSHENIIKLISEDIESIKKVLNDFRKKNDENLMTNIIDSFKPFYDDLIKHSSEIFELNTKNFIYLEKAINFIEIIEFNARDQSTIPKVHWYDEGYARILVGGTGLDRGYTVEGLTVSYLLRNPSDQLDTSLQRARFFGYHKPNLDFFRIFLPIISDNTFSDGSNTEYYLRDQIKTYLESSENDLVDWPRIFMGGSNSNYNLTNPNRIGYDLFKRKNQLCIQRSNNMAEISNKGLTENRNLYYDLFSNAVDLKEMPDYKKGGIKSNGHKFNIKDLNFIKNIFSEAHRFSAKDFHYFKFISNLIDKNNYGNMECPIILMPTDNIDGTKKQRSVHSYRDDLRIAIMSSGIGKDSNTRDLIYFHDYLYRPEDYTSNSDIFAKKTPTLQIYNFDVFKDKEKTNILNKDLIYFVFFSPDNWFTDISPIVGIQKR